MRKSEIQGILSVIIKSFYRLFSKNMKLILIFYEQLAVEKILGGVKNENVDIRYDFLYVLKVIIMILIMNNLSTIPIA